MPRDIYKLMSASGNSFCEVSIVHRSVDAVAWIEFPVDGNKLACGECTDLVQERRLGTVLRDLRKVERAECDDCGREYVLAASHNCRCTGGAPWPVLKD